MTGIIEACAAGMTVLVGLLAGAAWAWRHIRPVWRMIGELLEDWRGTPARPGVPARRGVMERLADLETAQAQTVAELTPNGGSSVKDQVTKIARHLGAEGNGP